MRAPLEVMSEPEESAPPSENSRRSRPGSVVDLEDAEEDSPVVQNELLIYVVYYYQINSAEMIKHTGLVSMILYNTADENGEGENDHTRTVYPRNDVGLRLIKSRANGANLSDIIGAVSHMYAKGKVLSGSLCAIK